MSTAFKHLVPTKFSPPRIGTRHVLRTSLLDQLQQMQQCTLALITGAAGYGKTTLLAQWRQACLKSGAEVAWVSLTVDDRSYSAFCSALLAALGRVGISTDMEMLLEDTSATAIHAMVAAIVEGTAAFPKELYVMLDDYHHVEAPAAHRLMQRLLELAPANLHVVLASRAAPLLSLSRLRIMNQLLELESTALPFDLAETRRFIDENLGVGRLNADELSLVHELTSGWPSCLQLIAIMLKNQPDARAVLNHLVWRSNDLQTYLSEEVIAHLPAELTEFAETLSLFRRFNASLAQALTGNANTAELIKRMEDENLLISRVDSDDKLAWYRLHRLFSEFLSTRLERRGAAAVTALHRRASRWFAENECLAEAVRHATLGDDLQYATTVIEGVAPATWNLEYLSPLLHLIGRLPEEVLFKHQRLLFLACLTVSLTARPGRATRWLAQLESSDTPLHPDIAISLPVIRAAIAIQNDETETVIDMLEPMRDLPLENPFLQYMLLAELTAGYNAVGRYDDSRRLLETHPIPAVDRNNDMAQVTEAVNVLLLLQSGDIRETERLGSPLLARSVRTGSHRSISGNLCAGAVAYAYYELDRIDDARETIANRFGLLHASVPDVIIHTNLCRARLDLLQKGPDAALAFMQEQTTRLRGLGQMRAVGHLLAEQVKVWLIKGNRARAAETAVVLDELATTPWNGSKPHPELSAVAALARGRLLWSDDPQEALRLLDMTRDYASKLRLARQWVRVEVLRAGLLDELKRADEAKACLVAALVEGHRLGLVRTFVDEGQQVANLLALLIRDHAMDDAILTYASDLLEKISGLHGKHAGAATRRNNATKIQTSLTRREIEILDLVAKAMSTKRIALALNITLETVKWNLRNIFSKLGVSSRYDAMIWARNNGLIE